LAILTNQVRKGTLRIFRHARQGSKFLPKGWVSRVSRQSHSGLRDGRAAALVGGNFGTRGMIYPEFALAAWAARRVGRQTGVDPATGLRPWQQRKGRYCAGLAAGSRERSAGS
jgi:hypothetical protein